jgi:hypothetical protein
MSVHESNVESTSAVESTDEPALRCASYMGCRHCEEGSLIFDPEVGKSRCRTCGKID